MELEGGARNQTVVTGTRVILVLGNTGDTDASVRLPNGTLVPVPAGQSRLARFETGVAGDFTVQSEGRNDLVFRSVEAEVVEVDLGDFELAPDHLDLEAGKTYLLQVRNVHSTAHNLYIGDLDGETLAASATIPGGATTSFVWTAAAGEFDMWCDVPGHADLGMVGTVSVA
jgi:uncharacterized cupredoxin-like copper-binding protein